MEASLDTSSSLVAPLLLVYAVNCLLILESFAMSQHWLPEGRCTRSSVPGTTMESTGSDDRCASKTAEMISFVTLYTIEKFNLL